jgi:hypothetical protein
MLATILSAHNVGIAILAFTILSHVLTFISQILKDLGKSQPSFIAQVLGYIGSILGFLNGYLPAPAPVVQAQIKS